MAGGGGWVAPNSTSKSSLQVPVSCSNQSRNDAPRPVSTFVGVACGPRPRLTTGAPSMSSVHAGLSRSFTLAEVFFGNLAVVASFMFFCLSQRYHVEPFQVFGVNHHNYLGLQKTEANQAHFAVVLSFVFAGHCKAVPNCIASNEIKPVILDVLVALCFVPCEHT